MRIKVGTFNLNNLFSRFNFQGAIEELNRTGSAEGMTLSYELSDESTYKIRTFRGRLVKAKDADEREEIAKRIDAMDADVLAVQEVEHIGIPRQFNAERLRRPYPYQVLSAGRRSCSRCSTIT